MSASTKCTTTLNGVGVSRLAFAFFITSSTLMRVICGGRSGKPGKETGSGRRADEQDNMRVTGSRRQPGKPSLRVHLQ